MAKKTISPSSDVYTAILAMACLAVLACTVFVTIKCIDYYGTEKNGYNLGALFKIQAPK
jgi:hypothetical protein